MLLRPPGLLSSAETFSCFGDKSDERGMACARSAVSSMSREFFAFSPASCLLCIKRGSRFRSRLDSSPPPPTSAVQDLLLSPSSLLRRVLNRSLRAARRVFPPPVGPLPCSLPLESLIPPSALPMVRPHVQAGFVPPPCSGTFHGSLSADSPARRLPTSREASAPIER